MKKLNFFTMLAFILLTSFSMFSQTRYWVGGEVISNATFKYGRFQFSMKGVDRAGALSNFFTYRNRSETNSVLWEEIDVEIFGENNAGCYQSNIIFETNAAGPRDTSSDRLICGKNFASEFTAFKVEWKPGEIKIFDDTNSRARTTYTGTAANRMQNAHQIRFNIWANNINGFAGTFDQCDLTPHTMQVAYVQHFPMLTGNRGNTFFSSSTDFEDGFDNTSTFDRQWTKANFTFDGNLSRFKPRNVTLNNSALELMLSPGRTTSNNSGVDRISCNNNVISVITDDDNNNNNNNSDNWANVASGYYRIIPMHSQGQSLTSDANYANNSSLFLYSSGNYSNQRYYITNHGNATFTITDFQNRALTVHSWSTSNGAQIVSYDNLNYTNQRWKFKNTGSEFINIKPSYNTNKSMDVYGWGTNNFAPIYLWDSYDGNTNQRFKFAPWYGKSLGEPTVAGLENINNETAVTVGPNPTNDKFVISGPKTGSVVIYNLLGKIVYQGELSSNSLEISASASNLSSGVYIVSVNDNNNKASQTKLIIK